MQIGSWNPVLLSCLLREFNDEIFGDAVGCHLIDILEYFGHTPKRAGWNGEKYKCKSFTVLHLLHCYEA